MKAGYEFKEQRRAFAFRQGTCDANVFYDVVERNEYQLPEQLAPDGLIVDVGGHIGSFTQACLERGARRIVALEPEPENYLRARTHLAVAIAAGFVTLLPCALTGSGRGGLVPLSGYLVAESGEVNTGGASVGPFGLPGQWVPRLSLWHLADLWLAPIGLLKLDCEGAEWDILEQLAILSPLPPVICGEYHPRPDRSPEMLRECLESRGYTAETAPHGDSGLGLFFAKL